MGKKGGRGRQAAAGRWQAKAGGRAAAAAREREREREKEKNKKSEKRKHVQVDNISYAAASTPHSCTQETWPDRWPRPGLPECSEMNLGDLA